MESASERERVLLGYPHRDPFAGSPLRRSSDVDFDDVFGGPPRRASFHGARRSRADSIDSHSRASWGREGETDSRRSHLGSREKPVFGDGSWFSTDRRRHLGDDFFRDIFQSSDSAFSSPRRGDLDQSLSSPSSNILSPNRPTSVSVSVKMAKGFDYPSLGSPAHHSVYGIGDGRHDNFSCPSSPNASSTVFATRSSVGHGYLRNDGFVSHQQSPLARETSHSFECFPLAAEDAFVATGSQIGKCANSLDSYISKNQFHFSIYKWAGKGVTLVMPSDLEARNECKGRLTRLPEVIVQEVQLPNHCDYLYPVTKASQNMVVTKENNSENDLIREAMEDDYTPAFASDVLLDVSDKKLHNDSNKYSEKGDEQIEDGLVQSTDKNSNANATYKKSSPDIMFYSRGEPHSEMKSLGQLFVDDMDKSSSHNIPLKVKASEVLSKGQRTQTRMQRVSVYTEVNNTSMHDSSHSLEDKAFGSNKVKGEVKEFIKKFSQDATPKQRGAFEMNDHRSKSNGDKRDKAEEQVHGSYGQVDEVPSPRGSNNIPLFGIPNVMKNQVMENAEENKFHIFHGDHKIGNLPSGEMMGNVCLQSETTDNGLHDGECNEENFPVDIEGYLVQQLSDQSERIQNSSQQEQIEGLDARVWEWSRGKEGNIRSLLSTLQYVLWPECGWKQVPLVDIIEGSSVKKAYQKALLCLHPDKLQQKGASWNQKYIAEKVFDILQEAWEHFNSLGQF